MERATPSRRAAGWAGAPPPSREATPRLRSIPAPVDQTILLEPGHHAAQPLPHSLDQVLPGRRLEPLEIRLAGPVLPHPLVGELPRLDVFEKLAHHLADALVDDARAARQVAVLGGVADGI